jgi:sodium transport system permease protein
LICPATRAEIVLGKVFTVMSFSAMTAILNLLSMGLTGRHMVTKAGSSSMSAIGDLSFPSASAIVWVLILLVPLASLFSALCLALATFARSSKEGQYYLTPLLMVTLGLTVFCISPGVELTPLYSILPVAGPALLLKKVLLAPIAIVNSTLWFYVLVVLGTSIGYSFLALWWAIDQFQREDVLFREAERIEIGLWLRQVLREKGPLPSFFEAGYCFVVIILLQFAAMKALGQASIRTAVSGWLPISKAHQALLIQQLALIAAPALLMGVILTTSLRQTFRLRWPDAKLCLIAVILPFVLHPLSYELSASLQWFFPQLPDDMRERLARLMDLRQPLWAVMLVFAAAPAVCEELAFRGFILSGFSNSRRKWLAIVLSSLTFGIFHMVPQQVFNAFLLGMVIALIAVRGNSIWPCMLFHYVWNALMLLHSRCGQEWWQAVGGDSIFARLTEGQLRYQWPTLVAASLVAVPLLSWLTRSSNRPRTDTTCAGEPIPALAPALAVAGSESCS